MFANASVDSSCLDDASPPPSSNSSAPVTNASCFLSEESVFLFAACSITNLLLLPLFILVLPIGFCGWGRRRPASGAAAAASLSDVFTCHSSIKQMVSMLAILAFFYGGYFHLDDWSLVSIWVWTIAEDGQALIHVLTCVERYLAVVKPITYRSLRQAVGSVAANVMAGCLWLTSLLYVCVSYAVSSHVSTIMYISCVGLFLCVISFCSVSVLCTLRVPGPGEVGGTRGRGQRGKQRAFYTITAILCALLITFGGNTLANVVGQTPALNHRGMCVELTSFWFSLPSSLVLPLLFLQREFKLRRQRHTKSR